MQASGNSTILGFSELSVPKDGSYFFVGIQSNSELTLDGIPYTLVPGRIDDYDNKLYEGCTYTLVPLKNGTVTPEE